MEEPDLLKLDNQLCFPFYAVSRLITRIYTPLLEEIGLTYPQYLVLLVLWEKGALTVKEITEPLLLKTNTVTPLLKRMEQQGFIKRERSIQDERKVLIDLTDKGRALKQKALSIPVQLLEDTDYPIDSLLELKTQVDRFMEHLKMKGLS